MIFDLDDTLGDYEKARMAGIHQVDFELQNHGIDIDRFWAEYDKREPKLYRDFVKGSISRPEYRRQRFTAPLEAMKIRHEDISQLVQDLNRIYIQTANKSIEIFDDVKPTLQMLMDKGIKTVILTNGPVDGQQIKVDVMGLNDMISDLYICEEIGVSKPHCKSFEFVLKELGVKPEEALMVGDSIEDDYEGAVAAGIKAILIDRNNQFSDFDGLRISTLLELNNFKFLQ